MPWDLGAWHKTIFSSLCMLHRCFADFDRSASLFHELIPLVLQSTNHLVNKYLQRPGEDYWIWSRPLFYKVCDTCAFKARVSRKGENYYLPNKKTPASKPLPVPVGRSKMQSCSMRRPASTVTVLAGMPHLISCHVVKRALLEQRQKDNRKEDESDESTLSSLWKKAILQIA